VCQNIQLIIVPSLQPVWVGAILKTVRRNELRSYQSVLILKPDLDEAQVDQVLEKITEFLAKYNGSFLKVEKWGKKRLAYRVKKSRFGYYINLYHTCESSNVSSLELDLKLYDLVLKFLVIRLEDSETKRAMSREYEGDSDEKSTNKKDEKPADIKEVSS
jgi:small subunit ribosomal protein S6